MSNPTNDPGRRNQSELPTGPSVEQPTGLSAELERLVTPTVQHIATEYPNGLRIDLSGPPEVAVTPRNLHPAFYGCYDWHSAVHGHWQLVRAMRLLPGGEFSTAAGAALDRHLTAANIEVELRWLAERPGFEMPYGMAWVLALCGELRRWGSEASGRWLAALEPLEVHAAAAFDGYCRTMTMAVRGGMHNQSAFSLALAHDWALDNPERSGDLAGLIEAAGRRFFANDSDVDLAYEPSAADFFSPSLAEADLMRRLLPVSEFGPWLQRFAPGGFQRLQPVTVVDPTHGQLAHWAGLNLSRSWMMQSVADALPPEDRRVAPLRENARRHRQAGLATADHPDYMISHWVPTFAVYLLTEAYRPDGGR